MIDEIRDWYNGYQFSQENIKVYNPFSVLLYLDSGVLANYWFESGTPSFLVNILRNKYKSLELITEGAVSIDSLGTFDIENIPLITILFQTGYLTIKKYDPITRKFTLGYPNEEVKISFDKHLMTIFTHLNQSEVDIHIELVRNALENNDIDLFCIQLKSLFANIPYNLHIQQEKYYHSLFQFMGTLLGFDIQSEIATDAGRIDLTLITKKYIYLFEFKFNETAQKALDQIESKKYYEKYLGKNKQIILVGVSFNRDKTGLHLDYKVKSL